MVVALIGKIALAGVAAATAGISLVASADVKRASAYGAPASALEAGASARYAAAIFERADLNNDGDLDAEEFEVLAVVTAELSRLNGFVTVNVEGGVRTVAAPHGDPSLSKAEKARLKIRAADEFAAIAGDDQRLGADEFVTAELERFLASDADRNGVLTGAELSSFALARARSTTISS
ncbi:MAG: hypothetical protein HXY21_00615 [Parvularculaceae bacterium]|nr:hypothetical protein [Parvularculaceae bacterium]